jgi:hypothetical protein
LLLKVHITGPLFANFIVLYHLKKRLTAFAKEYPQCCRQIDDDEQGGLTFESGRLGILRAIKEINEQD